MPHPPSKVRRRLTDVTTQVPGSTPGTGREKGEGMSQPPIARMAVTSIAATAVDATVLGALARMHGLPAGLAVALGCLAGGVVNFALLRAWVFPGRRGTV